MTFKALRKRVNLTCKEVSAMIGIQESSYRKYECLENKQNNDERRNFKQIFNCSDEEIMEAVNYHTKRRKVS